MVTANPMPSACEAQGSSSPASTPPSGTPACLTENSRLRWRSGAKRCSTSMPADDGGPIDTPIRRVPITSARDSGTALSKAPSTPSARPT